MADLDREARRGTDAARLLDEPLLAEAFEAIDARLLSEWRAASDPARREAIWHRQAALSEVRSWLKELVQTGRMARQQIGELNS